MQTFVHLLTYPTLAAFHEIRRQRTSVSASRCLNRCACRASNSVGGPFMTVLTWMRGWTTISTEGGPERRLYGP